jgi:hypothetical protein
MSLDEAQSELKLAASLTAESQLFLDYVRAERSTRLYIARHLKYLEQTVQTHIRTLEQASPEPDAAATAKESLTDLRQLAAQLANAQQQMKNAGRRS